MTDLDDKFWKGFCIKNNVGWCINYYDKVKCPHTCNYAIDKDKKINKKYAQGTENDFSRGIFSGGIVEKLLGVNL